MSVAESLTPALPQQMTREIFSRFLPHTGPMLLLNRVESWDANGISCSAISHNDANNPLRINGRLSTVHAMEYGAQAAAIHLFAIASEEAQAPEQDKTVFLGIVREFTFNQEHMDDRPDSTLQIRSDLVSIAPRIYQYRITASIDGETLAHGTISLIVGN